MPEKTVDIIDLDGKVYRVIHPGNGSDQGESHAPLDHAPLINPPQAHQA